jgi:dihydrofolate reductase
VAKVVWDVTMSLDPDDSPGRIFDWYFNGDTKGKYYSDELPFKLTVEDAKIFDEGTDSLGAMVAGRRTYDYTGGWGGSFFKPVPFFVVTHNPPSKVPKGTTSFTFVIGGIESTVKKAITAVAGKDVGVMGANTGKQRVEVGLLDELCVHIAPFLLGDGVRLYDHNGGNLVELRSTKVIESSLGWTHALFSLVK